MHSNLPTLARGEYLPGWISAVRLYNPSKTFRQTCAQLLGSDSIKVEDGIIRGVSRLLTGPLGLDGAAAKATLLDCTDLKFAIADVAFERRGSILEAVIEGREDYARALLRFSGGPASATSPLRRCPDCLDVDNRELGRPIWHARHQGDVSHVCEEHQRVLQVPSVALRGKALEVGIDGPESLWVADRQMVGADSVSRYANLSAIGRALYAMEPSARDRRTLSVATRLAAMEGVGSGSLRRSRDSSVNRVRADINRYLRQRILRRSVGNRSRISFDRISDQALLIEAAAGTWGAFEGYFSTASALIQTHCRQQDPSNGACVSKQVVQGLQIPEGIVLECIGLAEVRDCPESLNEKKKRYRQSFLEAARELRGGSVRSLKLRLRARYNWLLDNDRDWLENNLPSLWENASVHTSR